MSNCVLLDAVAGPLDRVRLSGQLAVAVASLSATTSPLARVKAAGQVSLLIAMLTGGQSLVTLVSKRRVKGDIMDGTHTELTLSNGKVVRIQRMDSTGSMGLPGWHDADSTSLNSFLGDTEADAIRVVLERENKASPAPTAEPVPVADPSPAEPAAEVKTNAHGHEYTDMAGPMVLYRSVSPEEWEQIKRDGEIRGGLNTFNGFDPRREVFFGDTLNSMLIGQGEDVTRRVEYQAQQSPVGQAFKAKAEEVHALEQQLDARVAAMADVPKFLHKNDAEYSALQKQYSKAGKELDALRAQAKEQMRDVGQQLRQQDAERGYSSVVLTTKPITGGRVYAGKHSGMGDNKEYGFDSGAVKLSDIASVQFVKDKQLQGDPQPVAPAAPVDTGRAPAGGIVGMNGEFYKGGTFLPNTALPKQGTQGKAAGTGKQLIEPGVYGEPPSDDASSIFGSYSQFIHVTDGRAEVYERPDAAIAAYVNKDVTEGRAFLRAAADAYNAGMRWFVPGEIAPSQEHYEAPAPEIVEYTTRKGKVIRGVVRSDLSFAEAKAIDEYTFKLNGGWFIREKHLPGMADMPPAPAPAAAKTPEELAQAEADRQANAALTEQKKRQAIADKLQAAGQSVVEKAEQEIGRDRLTNTARRASMAANVMARLEADRATGLTMQNLAAAIASGEAKHLAGITSRAAVETLQHSLRSAMAAAERDLSYAQQLQQRGRAPDENDVRFAVFPVAKWDNAGSSRAQALEKIKGKRGAPALADKIRYASEIDPETYRALSDMLGKKEADYLLGWWNVEQIARTGRLQRAGINNTEELRAALTEYLQFREGARAEDPIKKAERAIIGQKVGIDFFPTPAATAMRMAQLARISKGDRVLEPSAGNGNLADAAKAEGGEVDVIEISSQLRSILEAKGYNVVGFDFDTFEPEEKYDAIIMNPPFSDRRDASHIQRAFRMLKAGGTLVAIAGEGVFIGSDAKAAQFREWLDAQGAEVEALEQGTFKDAKLLATTGANARLIVIQK